MSLPASFNSGRVMVVAFEGWNDAGDAASSVLKHFRENYETESVTEFDAEDYFDYQFNRPMVRMNDEGEREIVWPGVTLTVVKGQNGAGSPDREFDAEHSLVLLQGTEPSRAWLSFCEDIIEVAIEFQVSGILFLGALLADVPHTRPISIFSSSEDSSIREALDLPRSSYEGPVGILSVLAEAAKEHNIPSMTIWASVPHYVHHAPSPKATLALTQKLEELLNIKLDNTELIIESGKWESSIDTMSQDDEELSLYIRQLEKARDTVDSPEASGDAIAEEFEKYLRLKDDDDPRKDGHRRGPEA